MVCAHAGPREPARVPGRKKKDLRKTPGVVGPHPVVVSMGLDLQAYFTCTFSILPLNSLGDG